MPKIQNSGSEVSTKDSPLTSGSTEKQSGVVFRSTGVGSPQVEGPRKLMNLFQVLVGKQRSELNGLCNNGCSEVTFSPPPTLQPGK